MARITYPWEFEGTLNEWYAIPFEERLAMHDAATRDHFEPSGNPDNSNYVAMALGSAISRGVEGIPLDRVRAYFVANYGTKDLALFGNPAYLSVALDVEFSRYDLASSGRTCSFTGFAQVVEAIMDQAVSYGKGPQAARRLEDARPTIWDDYLMARDAYAKYCEAEALEGKRPAVDAANLEYARVTFQARCREQVAQWREWAGKATSSVI